MEEIEILRRAIKYVECLAQGIDPLTGEVIPEDDLINNVRISRCMFYVADVLRRVEANGGEIGRKAKAPAREAFAITDEQTARIIRSDEPVSATVIAQRVKEVTGEEVKSLTAHDITEWCVTQGLLTDEIYGGKKRRVVTEAGRRIGITTVDGVSMQGTPYKKNLYDRNAQEYVIANLRAIADLAGK